MAVGDAITLKINQRPFSYLAEEPNWLSLRHYAYNLGVKLRGTSKT